MNTLNKLTIISKYVIFNIADLIIKYIQFAGTITYKYPNNYESDRIICSGTRHNKIILLRESLSIEIVELDVYSYSVAKKFPIKRINKEKMMENIILTKIWNKIFICANNLFLCSASLHKQENVIMMIDLKEFDTDDEFINNFKIITLNCSKIMCTFDEKYIVCFFENAPISFYDSDTLNIMFRFGNEFISLELKEILFLKDYMLILLFNSLCIYKLNNNKYTYESHINLKNTINNSNLKFEAEIDNEIKIIISINNIINIITYDITTHQFTYFEYLFDNTYSFVKLLYNNLLLLHNETKTIVFNINTKKIDKNTIININWCEDIKEECENCINKNNKLMMSSGITIYNFSLYCNDVFYKLSNDVVVFIKDDNISSDSFYLLT
jgi:hypothetical protein